MSLTYKCIYIFMYLCMFACVHMHPVVYYTFIYTYWKKSSIRFLGLPIPQVVKYFYLAKSLSMALISKL